MVSAIKGRTTNLEWLLYITILIEGYVVLSSELLVIRQLTAFVGGDAAIVAIVVSAVLVSLAFGYYYGGKVFKNSKQQGITFSIRRRLIRNALIAAVFLTFALSYVVQEWFFRSLGNIGFDNRLINATLFSFVFLTVPVFLLGQTTPLIGNYFSRRDLSETAGKMLFVSTVGSFFGATFTTIVLMNTIGVNNTAIVNIVLLCILIIIFSNNYFGKHSIISYGFVIIMVYMNTNAMLGNYGVVENNQYHLVQVERVDNTSHPEGPYTVLKLDNNLSSGIFEKNKLPFHYARFIENRYIKTLPKDRKYDILVIGAGGFTMGKDDEFHNYTYLDINKELKEISEKHLLKEKLSDNKTFVVAPARGFLSQNKTKWDIIISDAYLGQYATPGQLITRQYFEQIKASMKDKSVLIFSLAITSAFGDKFSVRFDNTFKSVFPKYNRINMGLNNFWHDGSEVKDDNVLYVFHNTKGLWSLNDNVVYTDNKNSHFIDRM